MPAYEPYCDHLEEQFWPVSRGGRSFPIVAPSLDGAPKSSMVRVIALDGPVDLSYSPAVAQAPTSIAGAGQFVDIHLAADIISNPSFVLGASGPVQVIQISAGEEGGFGDPAMLLAPTVDQGLRDMAFFVPTGFSTIGVTVVGPPGTVVGVDGNSITLTTALGPELAVGRIGVTATPNGFHRVSADAPVLANVFARNASPDPNTTLWFMAGVAEPPAP